MAQVHPEHSPDYSIHGNRAPVQSVTDNGSKSIALVALILGSVALGAVFMYATLSQQVLNAKVDAASAEALVVAKEARTHARMALDDVQRLRESLKIQKEH